jgi:hypothetical protein
VELAILTVNSVVVNYYKQKKQIGNQHSYIDGKGIPGCIIPYADNQYRHKEGFEDDYSTGYFKLAKHPPCDRVSLPAVVIRP